MRFFRFLGFLFATLTVLGAAGLVAGRFDGASASSTFSAAKRTRRSPRQSRSASQMSFSDVRPTAR